MPEGIQDEAAAADLPSDLPTYAYEVRELTLDNNGQLIYGVAYVPNSGRERVPLVICSHGLGGSYRDLGATAEALSRLGLAAYCFEFRGGGGTMSAGEMTDMSVMTEVSDLEVVMTAAQSWDFVDPERIVLFGASQGGAVSAITASRHTEQVAGLMLWYPAFSITDDLHDFFPSLDQVGDSYFFRWVTLGRIYAEDMWDYDVFADMGGYAAPVLIVHGSADAIVDVSYSVRAAQTYPDAELVTIDGAGHGFTGQDWEQAVSAGIDYLRRIGVVPV